MKVVLGIVAAAFLFIPGGQAFAVSVFTSLGASTALATAIVFSLGTVAIGVLVGSISSLLSSKKPVQANEVSTQRLNKSVVPEAARKIVFGRTASPLDIRYWETYGADNKQYDEVIAIASHEIESFGDFYLEDEQHTFDGSGNSSVLGSDFKRFTRTVGVTGTTLSAGAGSKWTSSSSMTGCAFMTLKYVQSNESWPRGFPTRLTQEVEGALVYDPRLDSTRGGAGTHRVDDQTTWEYSDGVDDIGRNPALQMLWYLVGWRINGTLVCGLGVDVNSINFSGFIQAANDADTAGFLSDCVLSTGDNHEDNVGAIEASCGGRLMDTGGIYTFHIAIDDTASIVISFDESDLAGSFTWNPRKKMRDQVNLIAGKYVDRDSLYQFRPIPIIENPTYTSDDGYTRRANNIYSSVQDSEQAQTLARIELNQTRYQGIFQAPFNYKAMQAVNWDIVTLSIDRYGWSNKLFRIINYSVTTNGIIILTLEETSSSIYSATATIPAVAGGVGSAYDPRAKIIVTGLSVAAQDVTGDNLESQNGLIVSFDAPSAIVRRTEIQFKKSSDSEYITVTSLPVGETQVIFFPLTADTIYDVRVRHVTIDEVEGDWLTYPPTVTGNATVFEDTTGGVLVDTTGGTNTTQSSLWNTVVNATNAGNRAVESVETALQIRGVQVGATAGAQAGRDLRDSNDATLLDGDVVTILGTSNDANNLGGVSADSILVNITQALDDAATAQSTADGKIVTFFEISAPTAEGIGDVWFDTDDGNKQYRWNGTIWELAQDVEIGTAISDAADAQATADGKVVTFFVESAPTADAVGDLWFKPSTSALSRWNGSIWELVSDITIDNTAAAITSQGDLATADTVGTGEIDNDAVNKIVIDTPENLTIDTLNEVAASVTITKDETASVLKFDVDVLCLPITLDNSNLQCSIYNDTDADEMKVWNTKWLTEGSGVTEVDTLINRVHYDTSSLSSGTYTFKLRLTGFTSPFNQIYSAEDIAFVVTEIKK